ncbi:MAG: hypothetical protein M3069_02800 [Chloroflexota bacterium]|nr:hypothetical protein [Chloroflexota bacterium]
MPLALLVGALLVGMMPIMQTQAGMTATDAVPIGSDGMFMGTVGPSQSEWYKFTYVGGDKAITATLSYEPRDSNRLDMFLFTGDQANPSQPQQENTLDGNMRTVVYSDQGSARVVFLKVENDHPDRSVSFVGNVSPADALITDTAEPSMLGSPAAGNGATAITLETTGQLSGTLASEQDVWYRFYYAAPGNNATIALSLAPSADGGQIDVYTGSDVTNLGPTVQEGNQARDGDTISRRISLSNPQFVFFRLSNANADGPLAYAGTVSPFAAPPAVTPTPVAQPAQTPMPTAAPMPVGQAPAVMHDGQYYQQTGFRVGDAALPLFQSHGGVETFGYPTSRQFTFLGCPVQMYQRLVIQLCPGQAPALINLLDPEIFPYTHINGSVFPNSDEQLKAQTPAVGAPEYANIMSFVESVTPDMYNGEPVDFLQAFEMGGGLGVFGAPISRPQPDPTNPSFIYMRFQRVILHYRAGIGTEPLLLADYFKQVMLGSKAANLPADLQEQAAGSPFYGQYCPGGTRGLCRPDAMPGSDLTNAFEQG